MEIRKDFASASLLLERLLLYSKVFWDNNREKWGHLKTKEDFKQIYDMEDEVKEKFERIYSAGRDFANSMSYMLVAFNEPAEYPTLTSYVNSFDDRWFAYIDSLKEVLKDALDARDKIKFCPWAVERMIEIFDKQLVLHQDVADTINLLKGTDIYKTENGLVVGKNSGTSTHPETAFIDPSIIESLLREKPKKHDLAKVVKFCQEINSTFNSGDYLATSLLIRALINHIPPIFGHETFKQVVSQSTRSRQELFKPLEDIARDVADLHTHDTIRHKENLPTKNQVEPFKIHIEFLLHEILTELQK